MLMADILDIFPCTEEGRDSCHVDGVGGEFVLDSLRQVCGVRVGIVNCRGEAGLYMHSLHKDIRAQDGWQHTHTQAHYRGC